MKTRSGFEKREERNFFLYISPWIAGFLIFTLYPIVYSFILIFTDTSIAGDGKFIGLDNILKAFTRDELFYKSLSNTFYYAFLSVPLGLVCSFVIAMVLNQSLKGIGFFRTCFYIPYVTAGVAVTLLWGWIFNPQFGLLNYTLSIFGIQGPMWLADEKWAMPAIILMSLWSIGSSVIILLAGLQDIPDQLYESAEIDGAGFFVKVFKITIPFLTPTLFFNLITGFIGAFQVFMQAYVLTQGGPNNATYTYVLHIYNSAFRYSEMGYGSTLAWVLFVVILVFTLLINYTSKYWVYYEN